MRRASSWCGWYRKETGSRETTKKEEKTALDAFNKSKKRKRREMQQYLESQVRPNPEVLSEDILTRVRQQKSKDKREDTRAGMKDMPMAPVAVWLSEILAPMKLVTTQ